MTKPKIVLIVVILLFLSLVAYYATGCPLQKKCWGEKPKKENQPKVTLTFVGPFDTQRDWKEIFNKFNAYKKLEQNGFLDVTIKYKTLSGDYEDKVKNLQYDGKGPNIFMLFNPWLPEWRTNLLPAPKEMMTLSQYKNTFARATVEDFTTPDGKIYSMPLYVDTLALFYNEDMLLQAGYTRPPENWNEFRDYTERLRRFEKQKTNINEFSNLEEQSVKKLGIMGATFGGGWNVNRSQDIVILLAMQNNINDKEKRFLSFVNKGSKDAVKYYTSFTNPQNRSYTWNEDMMYSVDAFTQNKAAMMINYSQMIENIEDKTGGEVNYRIATIPQLNENYKVNYANYWSPVIPAKAPCKTEIKVDCYSLAWEFLNFATQSENAELYLNQTDRPAANLQLAKKQRDQYDGARSVFASQVLTAKSWVHPDTKKSDQVLVDMLDYLTEKDLDTRELTIDEVIEKYARKIKALQ